MKYKQWSVSPEYLWDLDKEEELQFISAWNLYLAKDLGKKIMLNWQRKQVNVEMYLSNVDEECDTQISACQYQDWMHLPQLP